MVAKVAAYPPLLMLADEAAYRARFEAIYCAGAVTTFDGITVRFQKRDFDHCFFESSQRNRIKDTFSPLRAERLEWIAVALQDATADRFQGWDRDTKAYDKTRRVTLVCGNYVVVIAITGAKAARFITAYVADTPSTLTRLKTSPKWTP
jgi:hypothetical protein